MASTNYDDKPSIKLAKFRDKIRYAPCQIFYNEIDRAMCQRLQNKIFGRIRRDIYDKMRSLEAVSLEVAFLIEKRTWSEV